MTYGIMRLSHFGTLMNMSKQKAEDTRTILSANAKLNTQEGFS